MPIVPPRLDDRSYDDLVKELIARIPAHTPEWTHVRPGDPGRTLIELFAWLGDTILYRANLIPERQRLQFLRLLGMPLRPATPATGIVALSQAPEETTAVRLRPGGVLSGPVAFETRTDVFVLPVTAQTFIKRRPTADELVEMEALVATLSELYGLTGPPAPYISAPVFIDGAQTVALDLASGTVDGSVWIALLVPPEGDVEAARTHLMTGFDGRPYTINIGVIPEATPIDGLDELPDRVRVPHVWEATTGRTLNDQVEFSALEVVQDTTNGLMRDGVVRLILPGHRLGAPPNDLDTQFNAGVGSAAPRLDEPALEARLVCWIRLRPTERVARLPLTWVGINAVEIDQRRTIRNRILGSSTGGPDQRMSLPERSVDIASLRIDVESAGVGFQPWTQTSDLGLLGRDSAAYSVDPEAGLIRFGDGVRGRIPEPQARVRVREMRAGGGVAGNLPAGTLETVDGTPIKVFQPMPTRGGMAAERIEDAELRIPSTLRHRNRAVTELDFRTLAASTPGVELGRVEVLPRFKPHQRRNNVPGVVSVMVLPFKDDLQPPNPRPDRFVIEAVHAYLDPRRTLGTELYVIGTEYVPIGIGVSLRRREDFVREDILRDVRQALRQLLWPLTPGGLEGRGWPLNQDVSSAELEVTVARVPGVRAVGAVSLFREEGDTWVPAPRAHECAPAIVQIGPWQLPELLSVVIVDVGDEGPLPGAPSSLDAAPNPFAQGPGVPVPVVPEVC